jgi:polyisoprenoid-binding protein YceI
MSSKKLLNALKLAALTTGLVAAFAIADTTYKTDQGHTEVMFSWSHAGVSIQSGEFEKASGTLMFADDLENQALKSPPMLIAFPAGSNHWINI